MARRKSKNGKKAGALPDPLVLAEKWAKKMGKTVHRGEISTIEGKKLPVLAVNHGTRWVFLREEKGIVIVFIFIDIPKKVQAQLDTLDPVAQEKFSISLKHQLVSHARTGYYSEPSSWKKPSEISRLIIEQRIRLSNIDHSSFNRFADAIQEVVTVGVRAMLVFGIIPSESTSGETTDKKPPKPPESMYA